MTTSGAVRRTTSTASATVPTEPTTPMSGSSPISASRPSRTVSWSSTSTTRTVAIARHHVRRRTRCDRTGRSHDRLEHPVATSRPGAGVVPGPPVVGGAPVDGGNENVRCCSGATWSDGSRERPRCGRTGFDPPCRGRRPPRRREPGPNAARDVRVPRVGPHAVRAVLRRVLPAPHERHGVAARRRHARSAPRCARHRSSSSAPRSR